MNKPKNFREILEIHALQTEMKRRVENDKKAISQMVELVEGLRKRYDAYNGARYNEAIDAVISLIKDGSK